jgi:putative transposase
MQAVDFSVFSIMKGRYKGETHVAEFALQATKEDIRQTNVSLDVARMLYNSTLAELLRRGQKMRETERWNPLVERNRDIKAKIKPLAAIKDPAPEQITELEQALALKKEINVEFSLLCNEFGVNEFSLNKFSRSTKNACHFKDHLDANTIQKIDKRVMDAYRRWCFQGGGKPRFKGKNRAFKSLEGKTNKQGIRFLLGNDKKPTRVEWHGMTLPVVLSQKDKDGYQAAALQLIAEGKISFTRIVKRVVKGTEKLYAQVILQGTPFVKAHHRKAFAEAAGKVVGTDLGVSTLAYCGEEKAGLFTGVAEIKQIDQQIRKHQATASRLLRLANPDNYEKGQKKKGRKLVTVYPRKKNVMDTIKTTHYLQELAIIKELHRKLAAKRKQMHDIYCNEILANGNEIITEKVTVKAWQKIFGKSTQAFAPAALMCALNRKAENAAGTVHEIATWKAKLSQYDHKLDDYIKKKLGDRAMLVGGTDLVQRDLYSAYLAFCMDLEKETVCRNRAEELWAGARQRLDAAVKPVLNAKSRGDFVPSSAGLDQLVSRGAFAA